MVADATDPPPNHPQPGNQQKVIPPPVINPEPQVISIGWR